MKRCDLHVHTLHSDGTDTPEALIAAAARRELSCVAITDHDSVEGVEAAIAAGLRLGVEVIPGIELTAEEDGLEVHMLGYMVEHRDPEFNRRLAGLRENRVERIHAMVEKLKDQGVTLPPESVFKLSAGGTVGRLHMARAMVAEGIVKNIYEAFNKYIGDRCPSYVAHFKLTPAEAIALVREFGGIPVLAHPYVLRRDEIIPVLAGEGLGGIEVYYPEHTQSMINFYRNEALRLHLLMTGGSDYHGAAKPNVSLGEIDVPYELAEGLREAKIRGGR